MDDSVVRECATDAPEFVADGDSGGSGRSGWRSFFAYDESRLFTHYLPLTFLGLVVLCWLRAFVPLAIEQHRNYFSSDFDLGIFDQATWLLAHGRGFITVRGLPFLGHHLNLGLLLFVPAYWLGAGPEFLNVMVVVALAATVVPIVMICRHYRPQQSWLPLAISFAFLYSAIPQDMISETFHPEKIAIPFMFLAVWAAVTGRWRWFAAFVVLTLIWKEDLAFFTLMLGLGVAWKRDRKIGLVTAGASLAYLALATRVILPHFSGGGAFYADFLGPLGNTPTRVAGNLVRHPQMFADKYNQNDGTGYFVNMQRPWMFTSLLSPASLLLALPTYLINVLSSQGYTQDITRHYVTMPFVASAYSSIRGVASRTRPSIRGALALGIVFITVWSYQSGNGPWTSRYASGVWGLHHDAHAEVIDAALRQVPADASVTATYRIVPHLTHRPEVFSWPNPWMTTNWGINDQNPRDSDRVDYLVIDRAMVTDDPYKDLLRRIEESPCYSHVFDQSDIVVLKREATGCPV